ncbi:hypothetical protein [Hymenobacter sedentarius]|uniref:hypothetical protein n=1 Tax=Hymenobacter sedentarius TaxID=1411621 RepID=UPI0012FD54C8|nr:hypothetical protein [Hymenobacter sedentarius]
MKRSKIVFSVSIDYDDDCLFDINVIRPDVKAHAHFYGDVDTFAAFGKALMRFPQSPTDTVSFEVGQVGHPSSFDYLLIKAYCASPVGDTTLKIIADNNEEGAAHLEFSIASEAAAINKLGGLLANWQMKANPQIVWKAETR